MTPPKMHAHATIPPEVWHAAGLLVGAHPMSTVNPANVAPVLADILSSADDEVVRGYVEQVFTKFEEARRVLYAYREMDV